MIDIERHKASEIIVCIVVCPVIVLHWCVTGRRRARPFGRFVSSALAASTIGSYGVFGAAALGAGAVGAVGVGVVVGAIGAAVGADFTSRTLRG